jgi:ZIP family zinc transporter
MNYTQLLILGAVAGFTIFLGLPLVALQNVSVRKKGFLNAVAIGILVFLIMDVFSHAWAAVGNAASAAFDGSAPVVSAVTDLIALFGGIALGLLGLVLYESRYMRGAPLVPVVRAATTTADISSSHVSGITAGNTAMKPPAAPELLSRLDSYRLSMMIAMGIGAHNFSEGLAIGQSYVSGAIGLAVVLVVGFGAHNATEGFGIIGPLSGLAKRPSPGFLATVGLVGGGPTFLGTIVGSLIGVSDFTYIFFLSIAGGALVYVSMLMYSAGRRQTTNRLIMTGVFVGLCAGFLTDLIVTLGKA